MLGFYCTFCLNCKHYSSIFENVNIFKNVNVIVFMFYLRLDRKLNVWLILFYFKCMVDFIVFYLK